MLLLTDAADDAVVQHAAMCTGRKKILRSAQVGTHLPDSCNILLPHPLLEGHSLPLDFPACQDKSQDCDVTVSKLLQIAKVWQVHAEVVEACMRIPSMFMAAANRRASQAGMYSRVTAQLLCALIWLQRYHARIPC